VIASLQFGWFMADAQSEQPRASWFGGAADDLDDELIGKVLSNSYRVVRVLGEGAMGRVYAAEHTRLAGKRFAVKVLHPELMRYHQVRVRFEREGQAISTLLHPNVVGVYDVDEAPDGRPYLVCEYLEGIELGELLEKLGKLPVKVALHVGVQLCRALAAAHQHGVLHRDMKPENVFVVGEERAEPLIKVLDFGLARVESAAGDSLTQAGTVMGTPSYMAPEQARGDRVDARADVYAVGAILYRALTGQKPFDKDDTTSTLAAVLTEEPARPRSVDPSIPEEVELVIQRAMARSPDERFRSAEDLERELAALLGSYAPAQAPKELPPPRDKMMTLSSLPRASRSTLVAMASLAFTWTLALLVSGAASAAELFVARDRELSTLELSLLVATVFALMATPTLLGVRHLRQQVWNNSPKVSRAATVMRAVLLASMSAYGAAALVVRLVDAVLSRLVTMRLAWPASAAAWPAWSIVYLLVGAVAAGATALSFQLGSPEGRTPSPLRRTLAGPVLAAGAALLACGIVYSGFVLRAAAPTQLVETSASTAMPSPDPATSVERPAPVHEPPPPSASIVPDTAPAPDRASASELNAAIEGGTGALEALAKKYPEDSAVMKSLVETSAKDDANRLLGLEWGARLLERDPEAVEWKTLTNLVLRSAVGAEPAASRAFDIMASKMQTVGPDMLYDLMIAAEHNARQRARTVLARKEVRDLGTPALRIAYELKSAPSCKDQIDLLDRAVAEGDARSVAVLVFQVEGTRKGCGPRQKSPCPPKCPDKTDQDRMRAAIAKIKGRG
jgi:serine/threonine protein kinase